MEWKPLLLAIAATNCAHAVSLEPIIPGEQSEITVEQEQVINSIRPYVINGTGTDLSKYPNLVSLQLPYESGYFHFCTGTIIADEWVMTAAHCLADLVESGSLEYIAVFYGDAQLPPGNTTGTYYAPSGYTWDTDYDPDTLANDMALLQVPGLVASRAVPLASIELIAQLQTNTNSEVVGWGRFDRDNPEPSTELLFATQSYVRPADCAAINAELFFVPPTATHICAGDASGNTSACQGDSGGPLYIRYNGQLVQIGVTSAGTETCGLDGELAFYTNVGLYQEALEANIDIEFLMPDQGSETPDEPDDSTTTPDDTSDDGGSGLGFLSLLLLTLGLIRRRS